MESQVRVFIIGSVVFAVAFLVAIFAFVVVPEFINPNTEVAQRRLRSSVTSGNLTLTKWFLKRGGNANANAIYPADQKRCLLAFAMEENNPQLIKLLVDSGANVNVACLEDGSSPLSLAIQFATQKNLEELLKLGADPKQADHIGRQAIHVATIAKNRAAIETLLKAGVDINTSMKPPSDFANHVPTQSEREDEKLKKMPTAYWTQQPRTVEGIMAKKEKRMQERNEIAQMRDQAQLTPLMLTAVTGDTEMATYLLDVSKAQPNFKVAGVDKTARDLAFEIGEAAYVHFWDKKFGAPKAE